jgi:hypothetical protein
MLTIVQAAGCLESGLLLNEPGRCMTSSSHEAVPSLSQGIRTAGHAFADITPTLSSIEGYHMQRLSAREDLPVISHNGLASKEQSSPHKAQE